MSHDRALLLQRSEKQYEVCHPGITLKAKQMKVSLQSYKATSKVVSAGL
jgi:hypothetical protein